MNEKILIDRKLVERTREAMLSGYMGRKLAEYGSVLALLGDALAASHTTQKQRVGEYPCEIKDGVCVHCGDTTIGDCGGYNYGAEDRRDAVIAELEAELKALREQEPIHD